MPLDPELLCEIWDECSTRLGVIARAMGDGGEDAVQEAFVELAKQSTPPRDPLAWLVRVARNRMTDRRRSEKRRKGREQLYSEQLQKEQLYGESRDLAAWGLRPVGSELINEEESQALAKALRALPLLQHEVLVMHVWGEMTFAQIAEATKRSTSSCHREYQAALQSIAVNMRPQAKTAEPRKLSKQRRMMI